MNIALANKQDVKRIAESYSKLFAHVNKKKDVSDKKKLRLIHYVNERLNRSNYSIYVHKVNNQIVGTVAIKIINSKRAFLTDAFVEPEFRRTRNNAAI